MPIGIKAGFIVGIMMLALFGGYVCASVFFLKFPHFLHKKKKIQFKCRHISHRGGAGENLENTLTAFQHAFDSGTEMLEIDCHITKDGHVVVSHDNKLTRTTGCDILITETLYTDLPLLKPKLNLDFYQKWETKGGPDRQIPLLKDVFERFPQMPINIDIKIDNDELIHQVSELIKLSGRENFTVWGNRSSEVHDKCVAENPNIPTIVSFRRVLVLVLLYWVGLLPFVQIKESFYEILMPSIILKAEKFHTEFGWKLRTILRISDWLLMSRGMFGHLKKRGIQVYLWVLNEEDEYKRAFELGASGVMTDFPTKLKTFLDKNQKYMK